MELAEPTKLQRRNYYLIILSMVSMMVTTSTIYMVLPLFFEEHGMSRSMIGVLISVGTFAGIVSSALAGKYSDSHGRKPVLLAGVALYAVVFFLFAIAGKSYNSFLVLRFIEGFAFYMTPVSITTMAADIFPPKQRGKAMALYTMSSGIGQFVGPLFAGVFLQSADFTTYFYFCGAFVALSAVIIFLFVKETRPTYVIDHQETLKGHGLQVQGLWGNIKSMGKVVAIFFVAVLIYRTGNTMVNPFFSLYLKDVLHIDVSQTSYFFALRALMTLTFAPITGYFLDRVGRKPVFLTGIGLLIVTMLGYRSVTTYDQVLIIRALESVSNAVLMTTTRTYVADLLRPEVRGFGMGLYMTIVDESSTMGALVGGWIAEVYDFATIFLIGAITAAACLVITFFGVPEPSNLEQNKEKAEVAPVPK
ncbi:MFS transporter [Candidatus Bathyarchaeota archaeon]|nr:MFS transporter [Candidatus Bathyarchaeota archaeon]